MNKQFKNFLFCSVGRRGELIKNFKSSLNAKSHIIATDCSKFAPALYFADQFYMVPKIDDPTYLKVILDICKIEKIDVITTFIDPEIEILSKNRQIFNENGIEVLAPYIETAEICFDKLKMHDHAIKHHIPTITTYGSMASFKEAYDQGRCSFPVFVKPRTGSGSVGAQCVNRLEELERLFLMDNSLIIQELMVGEDIGVDIYIDTLSKKPVRIFPKKKLETKIGGATKTISFKDERLIQVVKKIVDSLDFNGPIDIDFFYQDGIYYLTEINPRFGGAYLHAYGAGVDFVHCIVNNLNGFENNPDFYSYEEDIVMMMYDSVVIKNMSELGKQK